MLWLWVGELALAAPSLSMTGLCPFNMELEVSGVTPGGRIGLIQGDGLGSDLVPGGSCRGEAMGVSGAKLLGMLEDTDGDGVIQISPSPASSQCSAVLQAWDPATCTGSNVQPLNAGYPLTARVRTCDGGFYSYGFEDCWTDFDGYPYPVVRSSWTETWRVNGTIDEAEPGSNWFYEPGHYWPLQVERTDPDNYVVPVTHWYGWPRAGRPLCFEGFWEFAFNPTYWAICLEEG